VARIVLLLPRNECTHTKSVLSLHIITVQNCFWKKLLLRVILSFEKYDIPFEKTIFYNGRYLPDTQRVRWRRK
jgi:hypothetical protein